MDGTPKRTASARSFSLIIQGMMTFIIMKHVTQNKIAKNTEFQSMFCATICENASVTIA
jgi:hypothetical protein